MGKQLAVRYMKWLAWGTDPFTSEKFWKQLAANGHCTLWWVPSVTDELFYVVCRTVMKTQPFVFPHCVFCGAGKSWGDIIK